MGDKGRNLDFAGCREQRLPSHWQQFGLKQPWHTESWRWVPKTAVKEPVLKLDGLAGAEDKLPV